MKKVIPTRVCPNCNKIINYTSMSGYYVANRKNTKCHHCSAIKHDKSLYVDLFRNCPKCGKEITYSHIRDKIIAHEASSLCKVCSGKINGFKKGHKNTNKIPVFDCWVNKYGVDIANKKRNELSIRQSKNASGKNNPMYGKESPNGSGNGWSGWYKGWFFRSLYELSYVVKELDGKGVKWKSAECKELTIPYIFDGSERTYRADFYLYELCKLVECKPLNLQKSQLNVVKFKYANDFCNDIGIEFVVLQPDMLSDIEIMGLYLCGDVIFTNIYDKKFTERYYNKIKKLC